MNDPPEKSQPDKPRGKRSSPDLPAAEADFWDLEDEELEPARPDAGAAKPTVPKPADPAPTPAVEDPSPPGEPAEPAPPAASDRQDDPPPPKGASGLFLDLSKAEKGAIIGVGACLLLATIWGLGLFFKHVPTESPDAELDFPIVGEVVTLGSASTYWKKPDEDSERGVRPTAKLIPAGRLIISAGGTGALRIFFRDDTDDIVGDPITVVVTNGSFANGAKDIEIAATDGFSDEGDHAAYVTEQISEWHMVITEGPNPDAPGSAFSDLCRLPVSKSRQ